MTGENIALLMDDMRARLRAAEARLVDRVCGSCGRDAVAGDCYGCAADRWKASAKYVQMRVKQRGLERDRACGRADRLRAALEEILGHAAGGTPIDEIARRALDRQP